jgi:D-3-phosphoglycerate dehydrogenase
MKRPVRILLTHTPEMRRNYFGDAALKGLGALGDVVMHDGDSPLTKEDFLSLARGCSVVISDRATPIDAAHISGLDDTAAILRVAVDTRNIDDAAASTYGILVTRASRSWLAAVSEHAIGLMIDAARGISEANIAYKSGVAPRPRMGRQLAGATAGIIGYGPLGMRVATLCRAFGMSVVVHDPYVIVDGEGIEAVALDDVFRRADFLLPLAVATDETENIVGARRLGLLRRGAILINVSRGNLIDEGALESALESGALAAAAVDVGRAPDQMPSESLARRRDVTATPHIGGLTPEGVQGQALEVVEQLKEIIAGGVPEGSLNAHAWTRQAWISGG